MGCIARCLGLNSTLFLDAFPFFAAATSGGLRLSEKTRQKVSGALEHRGAVCRALGSACACRPRWSGLVHTGFVVDNHASAICSGGACVGQLLAGCPPPPTPLPPSCLQIIGYGFRALLALGQRLIHCCPNKEDRASILAWLTANSVGKEVFKEKVRQRCGLLPWCCGNGLKCM